MKNETKWSLDQSHSEIAFKVRHFMISNVKGTFKTFDASIYTTGKDFTTAVIDLWIDAASISTGDAERDGHLKGPDFFDAEKHKQLTFTSSTIGAADASGNHELWGELTMAGVTHNIKLDVEFGGIINDPYGNEKAGFTVTGKFDRSEWGLVWNTPIDSGGWAVSNEVHISCEIELTNSGYKNLKLVLDEKGAGAIV